MRRGAIAIGGLITVALAGLFAVGGAVPPLSPEARFDAYLRAAAGGAADRGWSFVSDTVRDLSYRNDQAAYIRDAEAADWDAFRWAEAEVRWTDDGFASVRAPLLSPASSVPAFLILNGMVHGECSDGPTAIGVFTSEYPFGREIGAGGLSGGQRACNAHFIGDAAYADWLFP